MTRDLLIEDCTVAGPVSPTDVRSIFIQDGRIARLSTDRTQTVPGDTVRVNAFGGTALPGLIDSHCHLVAVGEAARTLDLKDASNLTSIRLRVFGRAQKAPKGAWILGAGWDQELLSEGRQPRRDDVDDLTPDNPLFLSRVCSRVALLNSRAMGLLGITEEVRDPAGGAYERDQAGRLTGIVKEEAARVARRFVPAPDAQAVERDILLAEYEAAKNGITTVHCFLSTNFEAELDAFADLSNAGGLALRHRLFPPSDAMELLKGGRHRAMFRGEMLRIQGVGILADGSLGARTAALTRPYADEPSASGMMLHDEEQMAELVSGCRSLGLQAAIHASGDSAVDATLRALGSLAPRPGDRPRIEHACLLTESQVRRAVEIGASFSAQPHAIASGFWAARRVGDRSGDLYPLKTILERGANLCAGSDAPSEPLNPMLGIWAAVYRQGSQALTMAEAIGAYTAGAAYSTHDEASLGAIREGGLGDVTVLDSDIREMHPAMLRRVGVAATVVDGQVAYSYEGAG